MLMNNNYNNYNNNNNLPDKLFSGQTESTILGCLLQDSELYNRISHLITTNDFVVYQNQQVFNLLKQFILNKKDFDLFIFFEALKETYKENYYSFEDLTNIYLLGKGLSNSVFDEYINILKNLTSLRKLYEVCDLIQNKISNCNINEDTDKVLNEAEELILGIRNSQNKTEFQHIAKPLREAIDRLEVIVENNNNNENQTIYTGLPSGFKNLDNVTNGFQNGDLIILAGRPSMGKTAFALNIAENVALNKTANDRPYSVAVFSLEMSSLSLTERLLSSVSKVPFADLKRGTIKDEHWHLLSNAINDISNMNLYINEQGALDVNTLRSQARHLSNQITNGYYLTDEQREKQQNQRLDLIIIDYLQLINGSNKNYTKVYEVAEITRGLKTLAKELNVPVICLSQLSRDVESRPDKRPLMKDLRDSGAIEQDADLCIFMYRDEYYNKDNAENKGKAEAIISKHRNGETGTIKLLFNGDLTRFSDDNFYDNGNNGGSNDEINKYDTF